MSRDKGSWATKTPYHPESREREAAKFLRITMRRYFEGRDGAAQVDEAAKSWMEMRDADHREGK